MQRQGWALTLVFPNRPLEATCNSFKCTHTHLSDSRPCVVLTHSVTFSSTLYVSLSLLFLSTFFSSVSHHLSHFPLCISVFAPLSPHPCGCFPAAPAVLLHHSVYMNLGLTHSLLACLLWYALETENRIEQACSTAPLLGDREDILHRVNLLLFRQADFYFRLCCFPLLRHCYCIIRHEGQQWSGLTVWARLVSPPSSSLCVCVAQCLSGFLITCLNLSAMPGSSPHSKVCQHTQSFWGWQWMRVRACVHHSKCINMCFMRMCVAHFQKGQILFSYEWCNVMGCAVSQFS